MLKNKKIFLPPLTLAAIMLIISGWSLATYLILLTKQKFVYTGLLLYIVKGGFALSVIVGKRVRSAEGMWVFFILTLPTLAIPIYLISARSSHAIREKALIKNADAQKPRHESFEDKMLPKCNQSFAFLSDIASNPNVSVYTSTKAKYYAESSEMLHSLYDDLNGARQFIFLEFYTVAAGEVFGKVCDILKKKASEGVEIRILYDAIGSLFKVPENLPQIMRSIGVEARACFSLFSSFPGGINNRNHRKIAIIDGEIAYTGGINLADEYIYSRPKMGKWKDAGVRIRGEGVVALTHTFLSDFVFSGGSCPDFLKYYKCKRQSENSPTVIFQDGPYPLYKENLSEELILSLISSAEKSFVMTSPYLVFGPRVFSALESAVSRGVRVKITIPATYDKRLTSILTRRYAKRLVGIGAEVYLYQPGFLHSKIYSSDKRLALIGTVNLDHRSLTHNFENGIIFTSRHVIEEIESDLYDILSVSTPYAARQSPIACLIGTILELFAPLF